MKNKWITLLFSLSVLTLFGQGADLNKKIFLIRGFDTDRLNGVLWQHPSQAYMPGTDSLANRTIESANNKIAVEIIALFDVNQLIRTYKENGKRLYRQKFPHVLNGLFGTDIKQLKNTLPSRHPHSDLPAFAYKGQPLTIVWDNLQYGGKIEHASTASNVMDGLRSGGTSSGIGPNGYFGSSSRVYGYSLRGIKHIVLGKTGKHYVLLLLSKGIIGME